MKERMRNFLVGLFVLAALSALSLLMVWFGEAPDWLGRGDWLLEISGVDEVQGIGDGTPVYLSGVEVGRVQQLDFKDPDQPGLGVVVHARIKQRYSVPLGSTAKVYPPTLGLGAGQVSIIVPPGPPGAPLDKKQARITGVMASKLEEIITRDFTRSVERAIDNIGTLADKWALVGGNVGNLFDERSIEAVEETGLQGNVATIVERIDKLVANLNAVLGDRNVQADVKEVTRQLKDSATDLHRLVQAWHRETQRTSDNINQGIDLAEQHVDEAFSRVITVLETFERTTKDAERVFSHVADGKGTAGLFARDERLYEAAVLSFERLADLIQSIKNVVGKIERDGYITLAQKTPIGTFKKQIPVGSNVQSSP